METKVCTKCGIEKPLASFYHDKKHSDGRRSDCKSCVLKRSREYWRKNFVKKTYTTTCVVCGNQFVASRISVKCCSAKCNSKKWLDKNPTKSAEYSATYRARHQGRAKDAQKKWYANGGKEIRRTYKRTDKCKSQNREYAKNKRSIDPMFKARQNLSRRLSYLCTKQGTSKAENTILLLGCTVPYLKGHIALQFSEGMSWDNYGEWEIDHIIPCSSFDLADPQQQKKCFHYTNLQPLWKSDNRSKGAKLPEEMAS